MKAKKTVKSLYATGDIEDIPFKTKSERLPSECSYLGNRTATKSCSLIHE